MGIRVVPRQERPGYDPASGMSVLEYNAWYDKKFPSGDPGMVIANPYMKGPLGGESPIIANQRNIKTDPDATMIPLNPEMRSTYYNGGEFQPHVGNSWWQANEPIMPWNRKDWTEKSAGYAKTIGGWFSPSESESTTEKNFIPTMPGSKRALMPWNRQAGEDWKTLNPDKVHSPFK